MRLANGAKINAVLWILLAALLILFLFNSLNRWFDKDEFESIHSAWKILHGEKIYVDFFQHHNPFFYYSLVPVIALFGENTACIIAMRIIIHILLLVTLWITYCLSKKVFNKETALVTLLLITTANLFFKPAFEIRPGIPEMLFSLLSVLLLVTYYENKIFKYFIFSAISLGIAFLFHQKAIFLVAAMEVVLLISAVKRELRFLDVIIYGALCIILPVIYLLYLSYNNSLFHYYVFNWILNAGYLRESSFLEYLDPKSVYFNGPLWFFYILGLLFFKKTVHQWKITIISLIAVCFLCITRTVSEQYFMIPIVLAAILAAHAVQSIFRKRKIMLVFLILISWYPFYDLFKNTKDTNSGQLAKIDYVLSITSSADYVYDGDIQFNTFRKDIDYFWFSLERRKEALATYQVMSDYEYGVYESITLYRPRVISSYDIDDDKIIKDYIRSDKYNDIYIRNDASGQNNQNYENTNTAVLFEDSYKKLEESLNTIKHQLSKIILPCKTILSDANDKVLSGKSLSNKNWKIISNYSLRTIRGSIDRNYDTYWKSGKIKKHKNAFMLIDLGDMHDIFKIIIMGTERQTVFNPVKIYVSQDSNTWKLQTNIAMAEPFYWIGSMFDNNKLGCCLELKFPQVKARYIKIEYFLCESIEVKEVFVYQKGSPEIYDKTFYRECVLEAMNYLKSKGVGCLYADARVSEKIKDCIKGKIDLAGLIKGTYKLVRKHYQWHSLKLNTVQLNDSTAFLINNEDIGQFELMTKQFGIVFSKKDFSLFCAYYAPVFKGINEFITARDVQRLGACSEDESASNSSRNKILRSFAAEYFIWSNFGILGLSGILDVSAELKKASYVPMRVIFKNGVELLGYRLSIPRRLVKSRYFRIDYFWEINREIPENLLVFVYFVKDGKIIFQNDHYLLQQIPVQKKALKGKIIKESFLVKVPKNASAGDYEIVAGLIGIDGTSRVLIKDPVKRSMNKVTIGNIRISDEKQHHEQHK